MIHKNRRFVALMAACLLTGSLILSCSQTTQAGVFDFAIGKLRYTATVAEIIVSLMAGSGAAVTNTSYLNKLNSAYGIESSIGTITGTDGTLGAMYEAGLFSVDSSGAFIDNGLVAAIESVPEYTSLGISDYMATWATEGGVETVATSASENIGSAIGAGAAFGTLCQVAGAVSMGVSLGVLARNIIDKFGYNMSKGAPFNLASDGITIPAGGSYAGMVQDDGRIYRKWYYVFHGDVTCIRYSVTNSGSNGLLFVNTSGTNVICDEIVKGSDTSWTRQRTIPSSGVIESYSGFSNFVNFITLPDEASARAYKTSIQNGTTTPPPKFSPDVVGKNGNQRPSNYNNPTDVTSWPNMGEETPQGKGITAIPWDEYQDFVKDANYNTTINNTTTVQGDTYNNFVTNYYVTPDQIETGETVENPDYNPTVPQQPTPNEKPEISESEAQENTDIMTTPGLKDVFPFCIPWDIKALFGLLNSNIREAPVITIPFTSQLYGIDEDVEVDLSAFDTAAALLRTLELIGFAVGLAIATRYLIGAR